MNVERITMTWPQYLRNECSVDGFRVRLAKFETELLLLFLLRRHQELRMTEIIQWLWPHPDDEPDSSVDYVRRIVNRLSWRLELFQVFIDNRHGFGWTLREFSHRVRGC